MDVARVCERCEKLLSETATGNICPACIAQLGHAPWLEETAATVVLADQSRSGAANPSAASSGATEIREFGDYKLVEEIARGGMGVVYRARQRSLNRTVAVKVILAGQFAAKQHVQRFRGEAAAAGVLQHPNIVCIHEIGMHEGQHFFSMDFVEGQNLAQLVGNRPLPAPQAARYVKLIAEAIHYAHQQGILHRDLKPSNVLIDAATDQPRVTDFGLAKRLEGESSLTLSGQVLGSPQFMPPEQASSNRGKVGRQSDVFGLGGILYFLLTARAPFQGDTLEAIMHQVLNTDPILPRLLNPTVPRDLETICLKCLEKEPAKRYATAQELADEVGRFLADEPIRARPVTRAERAWRWCRRKPVVASLGAATLLLLVTVSIGAPIAAVRIAQGRQEAKNKANELEENLYFNQVALAYLDVTANQPARALKLLDACPERLRGWEWNYVNRRCRATPQAPIQMTNRLRGVALQGRHLAVVAGEDLQLWELEPSGKLEFRASIDTIPRTVLAGEPFWVTFSLDGSQLLVVKTNFTVQLWDVVRQVPIRSFVGHTNHVTGAAFHPNGREIATGSYDRTVRFWDADTGRQIKVIDHGEDSPWVYGLAYSPDGKLLAEGSYGRGIIRVWNSQTHEKLFDLAGHLGPTTSLAFSPDSRLLASTSSDDTAVRLWDMSTGKSAGLLEGPAVPSNAAFSPDGSRLVTGLGREVRVWQLAGRREALTISGERNLFVWATFSTDGKQIVSAGEDRTIRIWDASPWDAKRTPRPITLSGHSNLVSAVAFSKDGQRLFSSALDGTGLAWDLSGQVPPTPFKGAFDVSINADGQFLVSAVVDLDTLKLHVKIFDAVSLEEKFSAPGAVEFFSAALSPSGDQLVAGSARGDLHFWDWKKSNQAHVTRLLDESIDYVRFSPDGHWLAALGGMGTVKLLDARRLSEPQPGRELLGGGVSRDWSRFAFSHDAKRLGLGDDFNDVLVLEVDSGSVSMRLKGHGGIVKTVAFSPNGRLIASGGDDSTVRLWDAQTGELLNTLLGHEGTVFALAFSPDSRTLASGSQDRTIKLWRLDGSGLLIDGTRAR